MESLKGIRALSVLLLLAAASANAEDTLLVSGPGVEYWTPVKRVQPTYPRSAAVRGIAGCVAVQFVVEPDGRTSSHRILLSEPSDIFDDAAMKALKRWRFEPGPDNPDGEAALLTQTLDFALVGRPALRCRPDSAGTAGKSAEAKGA